MESVLDLVQPWLLDSILEKKSQRHVSFWGWFLDKCLGLNWKYIDAGKQKYVGSSSRTMQVFDGVAREVDINLFIMPHLEPYVREVKEIYEYTLDHNKGNSKQFRIDNPPYPSPDALRFGDAGYFTIECEVTPGEEIRGEFDKKVMPLQAGANHLKDHPNFGVEFPSFGMMGTSCLDCNHNCRPEIHPIEWLWWLDMHPENPGGWEWIVTLLHDDTRRFEDWSAAPVEGQIGIPFRIPSGAESFELTIEVLIAHGMEELQAELPSVARRLGNDGGGFSAWEGGPTVEVNVKGAVDASKSKWWIGDLLRDEDSGDLLGFLHLAASTGQGFSVRISTLPHF